MKVNEVGGGNLDQSVFPNQIQKDAGELAPVWPETGKLEAEKGSSAGFRRVWVVRMHPEFFRFKTTHECLQLFSEEQTAAIGLLICDTFKNIEESNLPAPADSKQLETLQKQIQRCCSGLQCARHPSL